MREKQRLDKYGQMSLSVKEDFGDLLNTWTRKRCEQGPHNRATSEKPDQKLTNELSDADHTPPACVCNPQGWKKYSDK